MSTYLHLTTTSMLTFSLASAPPPSAALSFAPPALVDTAVPVLTRLAGAPPAASSSAGMFCGLVDVDELRDIAEGGRAILLELVVVVGGSIRPFADTDVDDIVREEGGLEVGAPARRDDMDMSHVQARGRGWEGGRRRKGGRGGTEVVNVEPHKASRVELVSFAANVTVAQSSRFAVWTR